MTDADGERLSIHLYRKSVTRVEKAFLAVKKVWDRYHESRRCSRDTYPESYITKH